MQMPVFTWTFLLKIGATNHPGKGLDTPTQTGNAQMNRDIFMLGLPLFGRLNLYCTEMLRKWVTSALQLVPRTSIFVRFALLPILFLADLPGRQNVDDLEKFD